MKWTINHHAQFVSVQMHTDQLQVKSKQNSGKSILDVPLWPLQVVDSDVSFRWPTAKIRQSNVQSVGGKLDGQLEIKNDFSADSRAIFYHYHTDLWGKKKQHGSCEVTVLWISGLRQALFSASSKINKYQLCRKVRMARFIQVLLSSLLIVIGRRWITENLSDSDGASFF